MKGLARWGVLAVGTRMAGCGEGAAPGGEVKGIKLEFRAVVNSAMEGERELGKEEAEAWGLKDVNKTTDAVGRPTVAATLDAKGAKLIGELTERCKRRRIAVVMDGKVKTMPVVMARISAGKFVITGSFTREEAERLAAGLKKGMSE